MLETHLGAFGGFFPDLTSKWYLGIVCDPYIYEKPTPASKSYPLAAVPNTTGNSYISLPEIGGYTFQTLLLTNLTR